ncbi:hypothetical protein C0J52_06635, partial [Blattella germanica]
QQFDRSGGTDYSKIWEFDQNHRNPTGLLEVAKTMFCLFSLPEPLPNSNFAFSGLTLFKQNSSILQSERRNVTYYATQSHQMHCPERNVLQLSREMIMNEGMLLLVADKKSKLIINKMQFNLPPKDATTKGGPPDYGESEIMGTNLVFAHLLKFGLAVGNPLLQLGVRRAVVGPLKYGTGTDTRTIRRHRKLDVPPGKSIVGAHFADEVATENGQVMSKTSSQEDVSVLTATPCLDLETFVVVNYNYDSGNRTLSRNYVGVVVDMGAKDVVVKFLRAHDGSKRMFVFPNIEDEDTIPKEQITEILSKPIEKRGIFVFDKDILVRRNPILGDSRNQHQSEWLYLTLFLFFFQCGTRRIVFKSRFCLRKPNQKTIEGALIFRPLLQPLFQYMLDIV